MKKLIMILLLTLSMLTTVSAAVEPVKPKEDYAEMSIRRPSVIETQLIQDSRDKSFKTYVFENDYEQFELRICDDNISFTAYCKYVLDDKIYIIGHSSVSYVNVICLESNRVSIITDFNRVIEFTNVRYGQDCWDMVKRIPDETYKMFNA